MRIQLVLITALAALTVTACLPDDPPDFPANPGPPGTPGAPGAVGEPGNIDAQESGFPGTPGDSGTPGIPLPNTRPNLSTVPQPTSTIAAPAPAATVTTEGCYDRGYAGRTRDPNNPEIDIYMMVEPPDDPADDARAIAETLCSAGGRYVPPGEIRTMKVDYTLKQLRNWYSQFKGQAWQVAGVWASSVDVSNNRLSFRVLTELGRSRVFELARQAGIPANAVYAEISPHLELDNPPANPSVDGMEISVEYQQEIPTGQPTLFSVIVTNTSDQEKTIEYNAAYPADIAIFDAEGSEIWRLMTGVIILPGGSKLLSAGESITFPVSWSGLSHDQLIVPPGRYLVRGFVDFRFDHPSGNGNHGLSTAPAEIQIVEK